MALAHAWVDPFYYPDSSPPVARLHYFRYREGSQRSVLPRVDFENHDQPVQSGLQGVLRTGAVARLEPFMSEICLSPLELHRAIG